jgi:hypothetical protein
MSYFCASSSPCVKSSSKHKIFAIFSFLVPVAGFKPAILELWVIWSTAVLAQAFVRKLGQSTNFLAIFSPCASGRTVTLTLAIVSECLTTMLTQALLSKVAQSTKLFGYFLSRGACSRTQTLDLGIVSQVFYLSATSGPSVKTSSKHQLFGHFLPLVPVPGPKLSILRLWVEYLSTRLT